MIFELAFFVLTKQNPIKAVKCQGNGKERDHEQDLQMRIHSLKFHVAVFFERSMHGNYLGLITKLNNVDLLIHFEFLIE